VNSYFSFGLIGAGHVLNFFGGRDIRSMRAGERHPEIFKTAIAQSTTPHRHRSAAAGRKPTERKVNGSNNDLERVVKLPRSGSLLFYRDYSANLASGQPSPLVRSDRESGRPTTLK